MSKHRPPTVGCPRALSDPEKHWITAMKRLARSKPKTLRLYITDSDVVACKVGVSCSDVAVGIKLDVFPGCYLIDLHDGSGYGVDSGDDA